MTKALMNGWQIAIWSYTSLAVGTFLPVLFHMSKGVKPHPGGPSFKDSPNFSPAARLKLEQNFDRMRGTLGFWKSQAQKYRAYHIYCLFWIIPSTVAVPFLAQAITTELASKWFLSVVSAHAALLIAFYRGFKVEQNFRAFREGESELYDLQRLMLDTPKHFGATEDHQLECYFRKVALIRQTVRHAELDNFPTVDSVAETRHARNLKPTNEIGGAVDENR